MNTFKTVVVMSTLAGLGYGAHVILNKPINEFGETGALPNGWSAPHVQMDDPSMPTFPSNAGANPPIASSSQPTNEVTDPFADPQVVVAPPTRDAPNVPPVAWPTPDSTPVARQSGTAMPGGAAPAVLTPEAVEMNQPMAPPATLAAVPNAPGDLAHSLRQVPEPTAPGFPTNQTGGPHETALASAAVPAPNLLDAQSPRPPAPGTLPNEPSFPNSNTTAATVQPPIGLDPVSPIRSAAFDEMWANSQSKLSRDELTDALFALSLWYNDPQLTSDQRDVVVPLLDQLAGTVIYSREHRLEAPHIATEGETLQQIADAYQVSPDFLARVNGLDMTQPVLPGTELKVARGPFRAELSLGRRELTVFLGRYYAGRFSVGVGRDFPAQTMTLRVTEKDGPRPYQDAKTGQQVMAGAADNPFGNHWIGLEDTNNPGLAGIGIHGSGDQIDASDTRGYVSLSRRDADDLAALLVIGSAVVVQ